MPMNVPDFTLPVTSELSLPCVYGTTVVCLLAFLLCYVACSMNKSFCFHPNGQQVFCRLQNHEYDMAINQMIVLMSYTSVELSRSDASFLAAICCLDLFFFFFLGLYSVRAAIDSNIRCSYTRLHPIQQTNLQLS